MKAKFDTHQTQFPTTPSKLQLLAAMSSSRSDSVSNAVRASVRPSEARVAKSDNCVKIQHVAYL